MTREKAIKNIKEHCYFANLKPQAKEALDMAIKALEQEPCEDCVSREKVWSMITSGKYPNENDEQFIDRLVEELEKMPSVTPTQNWIPVSERLPETDNENEINEFNVLLWVKNKTHPEREPQIYLGKLNHVEGDDGSGNFWGIETKPCDWAIWGWGYFNEPEVIAWQPLPQPYTAESEEV